MMIVLVLAAMVVIVVMACVGVAAGAVVVGVGAAWWGRTRVLAPVFLLVIPLAALGALAGCFGIGAYLVRHVDWNLVVWGPVLGLVLGGWAGGLMGVGCSGVIWWRAARRCRGGVQRR